MRADTLHEALIDKLCRNGEGWQRGNWKSAFIKRARQNAWWAGEIEDDNGKPDRDAIDALFGGLPRLIPDAFRFTVEGPDTPNQHWGSEVLILEFLEVEIGHPMPLNKRRNYVTLWWRLDASSSFHFRVYRVERYGSPVLWLDHDAAYEEISL